MTLTDDSYVILLLSSQLGLADGSDQKPLTQREWNILARKIAASDLQFPGALLGLSPQAIAKALSISSEEVGRYTSLLSRGGTLALELERLKSLGIWTLTRADAEYPVRYRQRLKDAAPTVLFGAGTLDLLGQPGLAVVGSRNLDETRQSFAEFIGAACARAGLIVYSGGARGTDAIAMGAVLEARGQAVGILADSLERTIRAPEVRSAIARDDLTLLTPYVPNAGFSVGAAMGRNKLIYTLADYALVIASDLEKGGTWAGATEALKANWIPVFALDGDDVPEGNHRLLKLGARSFPQSFDDAAALQEWLAEHSELPPLHPPSISQSRLL